MNDTSPASAATPQSTRMVSLDAYRGLVMLLMMAEALHLCVVSQALPGSGFWRLLCYHQTHVEWMGCVLHDMIQPSFSFLVGVALPFSIASRQARGQTFGDMLFHAGWRALLLIALGVFLRSVGRPQTYFTFEDTLSQIGLGYVFLFVLGFRTARAQWEALVLILVGYWVAFALYPLPGADFDYAAVGVSQDWLQQYGFTDLAAHWNKNSNLAWACDTWFLNLFPREAPFEFNGGGYCTLSFIPTLGTMVLGLIAGGLLRRELEAWEKVWRLVLTGLALLGAGWVLHWSGLCPIVKRIWTPSWTLYSGGWCFLFLAVFYLIVDIWKLRVWVFPLVVIGMNSIAAYCMDGLFLGFIRDALKRHFGSGCFRIWGAAYEPLLLGGATLLVLWLILWAMYRRKIFLRI